MIGAVQRRYTISPLARGRFSAVPSAPGEIGVVPNIFSPQIIAGRQSLHLPKRRRHHAEYKQSTE